MISDDQPKFPGIQIIFFGAGSSCDFEKFFPRRQPLIERLISKESCAFDICKVECKGFEGEKIKRYFLANSSVGVISLANQKFDTAKHMVKFLKKVSVDAAALISGVSALFRFDEIECDLTFSQEKIDNKKLKNITVFKCPYFGGGMHYGVETQPNDGILHVAMIDSVSHRRLF